MFKGIVRKFMALAAAFSALAIGMACTITPSSVSAQAPQTVTFVVQHTAAKDGEPYGVTKISTLENCKGGGIDFAKQGPQTFVCSLARRTCEVCPYDDAKNCTEKKYCQFLVRSTHRQPTTVVFGQGTHNPTCVYATYWDWTTRQQLPIYGPC